MLTKARSETNPPHIKLEGISNGDSEAYLFVTSKISLYTTWKIVHLLYSEKTEGDFTDSRDLSFKFSFFISKIL